jgi:mono/diheme cytochrome c family protein
MFRSDPDTRPLVRAVVLALATLAFPTLASAADIQFNRDIRPILSENCTACHGPDPGARKAAMRLDTKEGLFKETKNEGPVVVPGKPEQSALWKRIVTTDPDEVMPPPKSHKTIKPEQRELLKQWIVAGAQWQPHWAFLKPERPPVPAKVKVAGSKFKVRNPIDAFVGAKLAEKGLKPNPGADRRTLARRLALDLDQQWQVFNQTLHLHQVVNKI